MRLPRIPKEVSPFIDESPTHNTKVQGKGSVISNVYDRKITTGELKRVFKNRELPKNLAERSPREYPTCPINPYKDWEWDDVPTEHLRWIYENFDDDGGGLLPLVEDLLSRRVDR